MVSTHNDKKYDKFNLLSFWWVIGKFILSLWEINYRESRAIDMESLAVVAGKYVWAVRLDIHILDNCGYVKISIT